LSAPPTLRQHHWAAAGLLLVALSATRIVSANPLSTFGFGSRETAMASANTADSQSFSAVFYNPAGLAHAKGLDLSIGYMRVTQRLSISGRDNGVDPVKGVVGGLVAPGKLFGIPFAFGLATHIPDDRISRVRTRRQDIPRWELYDNRGQTLFLAAALAVRPFPWLSVGGGVAFLSSTRGSLAISGEAKIKHVYDSQLRHEVDADLTTVRIPLLGVRFTPRDDLDIGLTYRGEAKLDLALDAQLDGSVDPEIGGLRVPAQYVLATKSFDAFTPRQLALGASYRPSPRLRVNLDLVYTQWSAYQSASSRTTSKLTADVGNLPIALPPDPKPTVLVDPGLRDRVVPRLGAEWLVVARSSLQVPLRVGYFYERSPVPPQTGLTNFVDADRHVVSAGAGVVLHAPIEELPGDVRLDAHGSYALLPEATTKKDSPADFVGDYTRGGYQWSIGTTLSLGF
jgi:long-subunit fatty acid transport protein